MRRSFKLALLSAAVLLVLGAAAVGVLIDLAASAPGLKPRVESAASDFLGRPLTIGALAWRRWPDTALVGTDVRLYEDAERTKVLVDAPVVEARIALLSVLKLAAGITELRLVRPTINLRRDAAGEWNAARLAGEIAARPDEPSRRWGTLAFNWFAVEGGTVAVEDATGVLSALPPVAVSGTGKLRFGRKHVHFPFELRGALGPGPAEFLLSGDVGGKTRLKVDVKNADASWAALAWPAAARWRGRWNAELSFDERQSSSGWKFHVRAAPLAFSASSALASLDASGVYDPASSSSFTVTAAARGAATDLRAKAEWTRGALRVELASPKADLNEVLGWARAAAAGGPPPRRTAGPPPFTASLAADELDYAGRALTRVHAAVRSSTGPYVVDELSFQTLGGTFTASGAYLPSRATFDAAALSTSTDLRISGSLTRGALALDVRSRKADLAEISLWARALSSGPSSGAPAPSLSLKLAARRLDLEGVSLRRIRAAVRRSTGPYIFDELAFQSLGGTFAAHGSYAPGNDALEIYWNTTGIDARSLFRLAGSSKDVEGILDSSGHMTAATGTNYLSTLNGEAVLDVRRLFLGDAPGLLKILSRLNITTLLTTAAGKKRPRLAFDEARGAFRFTNGRASAETPIVLENRTLQFGFMGAYDLPSRAVDGKVFVNFLSVTDEILHLIPGVNYILLGKEKGLVPIWLSVKGPGDDPKIEILSTRTIAGPVWNTLRRVIKLPQKVFDVLTQPGEPPTAEGPKKP